MQTKKRSNSQTSPNIADSKRRKKEMDDNAWEQWDETLLQMLGDVDTTMGKKYTKEFYLNLAKRMSEASGGSIPFSDIDIGKRVCWLRNMYRSYSEDRCTHAVMTPHRFQSLLRLCFYDEIKPIQVPLSLSGRRSTRRGGGGCSGAGYSGEISEGTLILLRPCHNKKKREMAHADNNSSSCLFIDTNLDTHFTTTVSHSDTVSDLKRKILLEHHPAIGDIKIDCLKVKQRQHFYHLADSMLVSSVFANVKDNWFLSVDASRLAQGVGIQQVDNYKVGDQLALPCATDNRSVDQRSPSAHLTIVPIVKHTEEDRPFDNEINSKKRTLVQTTETLAENASGSGPSVEKKRKTEEKEASVKASEDLGGENIRTNNANSMENNIQDLNDESTRVSKGGKCSGLDQEATVVSSSIENVEVEIPSEISQKEKDESLFVQNNSEALMAVEENIQQEIPSEISQKEKENELVEERVTGNEILSSSTRTSDCDLHDSEKDKTAEKDAADMSEKDLGSTVQESAGDIDNLKEDKESSRKQEPEVKLPRKKKRAKKSAARNKDESAKNKDELEKSKDESARNKDEALMERADNIVTEISSIVPATAHGTKIDKVSLSNAENKEVLEKMLPEQEVEISKPTEVVEETLKEIKDAAGRRKKKKDVGRSATRNDAASVTNEKNVLPHSGREESQVITLTEKNVSQGNDEGIDKEPENQNENMDGEKKNKRKKKTKKSAKNGEGGMSTEVSDPHLNETTLLDAARKDGDEVKGRDAQVSDVGLVTKPKKNKKSSVTGPEYPTNVVNDPNIPNTDQFETPKKKSKIDAPRISKSAHANKAHGEPSAENQKSSKPRVVLGLDCVRAMQKSAPEINKSQHAKSLLSGSGTKSGGDIDESSADDDALSGKSSSLGDSASSTDSRRNGSRAVKRKGAGGNSHGAGYSGGSRESGGSSHSVGQQAADSQSLSGVLAHLWVNYRDRVNANRLFYFTRLVDANPSIIPLFMDLPTHEERLQFLEDLDLDPYIPRAHN